MQTTRDMNVDQMDPAALVGWMLEGDTQPMDSQIYRDYNNIAADVSKRHNDSRVSAVDLEYSNHEVADHKKDIRFIGNQKSPTPPGWLSHKGEPEIIDELTSVPNLPAIPSLKQQISPITPKTVGKKRNFRGDIITPATETPGSALTTLFDASALKGIGGHNPAVPLSQMFAGTQAQSSPALNDLKSDPIFQRPSPNFNRGPASPPNAQSSPTKAIHSVSPNAIDAERDAYTPFKRSQLQSKQDNTAKVNSYVKGQPQPLSSDMADIEEDSLHRIITVAEERMLRDRKHAQKREEALQKVCNLRAPKRLQSPRKSKIVNTTDDASSPPQKTNKTNMHQITTLDSDSSSLSEITSERFLNEHELEDTKATDGSEIVQSGLPTATIPNGTDAENNSSFEYVAYEERHPNHSTHCLPQKNQRGTLELSSNEKEISTLPDEVHEQHSVLEYSQSQTRCSTVLIPHSQPAERQSHDNANVKQNNQTSIGSGQTRENAIRRQCMMSSSPPILFDTGEREKPKIDMEAQMEEDHFSRPRRDQANQDVPHEPFTPQIPKEPINIVLSTTATDQAEMSGEEQIEVPETDPPESMSSYRSTRHISKPIESGIGTYSLSRNLRRASERRDNVVNGIDRNSNATNYETARSKFSEPSILTPYAKESKVSQDPSPLHISPLRNRRASIGLSDALLRSTAIESNELHLDASHSSPIHMGIRKSRRTTHKHIVSDKSALSIGRLSSSFNTIESAHADRRRSSENYVTSKARSFPDTQAEVITTILPANAKYLRVAPVAIEQLSKIEPRELLSKSSDSVAAEDLLNSKEQKSVVQHKDATSLESPYTNSASESLYAPHRVLALFKDRSLYYWPATCLGRMNKTNPVYKIRFDDGAVDEIEAKHVCTFKLMPGDIVKVDIPTLKKNNYVVQGFEDAGPPPTPEDPEENVPTDVYGHEKVRLALKCRHSSTSLLTTVPLTSIYLTGTMWPNFKDRLLPMGISDGQSHAFRCLTPKDNPSVQGSPSSRSKRLGHSTPVRRDKIIASSNWSSNTSRLFAGMAFVVSSSGEEVKRNNLISTLNKTGATVLDEDFDSLFSLNAVQRHSFSSLSTSESLEADDLGDLVLNPEAENYGFTALLAHEFSRRVKHMQALALGLPVLHSRWITDCVRAQKILPWKHYVLPAGRSSLLDGAIISRAISTYDAGSAKLKDVLASRDLILPRERVLMVDPNGSKRSEPGRIRGKREGDGDRQSKYAFLTCAMGASAICRVKDLAEARKVLEKANTWTHVHVDRDAGDAKRISFSKTLKAMDHSGKNNRLKADVVVLDHEEVMQSLILGKAINNAEFASR